MSFLVTQLSHLNCQAVSSLLNTNWDCSQKQVDYHVALGTVAIITFLALTAIKLGTEIYYCKKGYTHLRKPGHTALLENLSNKRIMIEERMIDTLGPHLKDKILTSETLLEHVRLFKKGFVDLYYSGMPKDFDISDNFTLDDRNLTVITSLTTTDPTSRKLVLTIKKRGKIIFEYPIDVQRDSRNSILMSVHNLWGAKVLP